MRAVFVALAIALPAILAGCAGPGEPVQGTPVPTTTVLDPLDCGTPTAPAQPLLAVFHTSLGAITARLATDGAPVTVANFVTLARNGTYDGVLFHRVIQDFMIQTGDPLTKDPATPKESWGTGGTAAIPDEFSSDLQHDGIGVLSMANHGPNTGSSQFFITLAPTRHLDGAHAVFGRVIDGLDVLQTISGVATDDADRPLTNVTLERVEILDEAPVHAASVRPILAAKQIGVGREARFLVLGTNTGNVVDEVRFEPNAPAGWAAALDLVCAETIPGAGRIAVLHVTPPAGFEGPATIEVLAWATSGEAARTNLTLTVAEGGREVGSGTKVTANYVGLLANGRIFDTSVREVAHDAGIPTTSTFCVRDVAAPCNGGRTTAYVPFPFTVGQGVIEGFSALATGARAGETPTGRIPAAQAYGETGSHPLSGKDLIFELAILSAQ